MLAAVEWGEFRMGDLFEINTSKSIDKVNLNLCSDQSKYHFIGRTSVNNGVQGYIDYLGFEPNPKNTFSVIQIGENVAQFRNREWYASQNIFILFPKQKETAECYHFFVSSINSSLKKYSGGYSNYPTLLSIKNDIIQLPVKNGEIDFEFMESFIAELEAQRLAELEAYLMAAGLSDYTLSPEEESALNHFDGQNWAEFRMDDLFEKIKTNSLKYKANDLPDKPIGDFVLPALTAGIQNQGLNNFVPVKNATILKNVISISANGANTGATFYQRKEFTVLQDAYAIRWKYSEQIPTDQQCLYLVSCISSRIYGHYAWTNKAGWERIKNEKIHLPTKNGEIDFGFMELLISALQKVVIKDVVQYAERKIQATEALIKAPLRNDSEAKDD